MNNEWLNRPPSKEAARNLMNLSLADKVYQTCVNITDWDIFTNGKWYISFSGGKDSTVLAYIAARLMNGSPIPRTLHLLFCDTGLEYPEIRRFVYWYVDWLQKKFPRVKIDFQRRRPKKHFVDVIREKGYPIISKTVAKTISGARGSDGVYKDYWLTLLAGEAKMSSGKPSKYNCKKWAFAINLPILISNQCCIQTKEEPALTFEKNGLFPMVATMAEESMNRRNEWEKNGCNAYESKRPVSKPMSFWSNQDVLLYIHSESIPICSVYGDVVFVDGNDEYEMPPLACEGCARTTGCKRTGCIFCGFGTHLEKGDERRFVRLKQTHPKHWNYAINGGEWDPVDGMWKPSKTPGHIGLGMGRVLDYIGVPYE